MSDEQATKSGAEPVAASQSAPKSTTERLKSFLSQSDSSQTREAPSEQPEVETQIDPKVSSDTEVAETVDDEPVITDGQDEQVKAKPTSLKELAETLGADIEDILGIDIPTKIDGKEGKARLRDLLKSYQLESHLNQKSMAFADERKAFEAQAQRTFSEHQQRAKQLEAAMQVGQRLLDGEFANVDWEQLQATDRLEFNQKVVEYQQRQQALQHLAGIIGQEKEQQAQQAAQQREAYKAEQLRLLESKLPEWTDKSKREADIKGMSEFLKESYGIPPEQLMAETNHALILIARDAWKWNQLQKQKPATLKQVKDAPKLLKPGTPQSRASQSDLAIKQARDRLRSTGKVSDAANALKRLGVV